MDTKTFETDPALIKIQDSIQGIKDEMGKVIVGQEDMMEYMVIALLCKGHILIEGMPGVAKTLASRLMAQTINQHSSEFSSHLILCHLIF